MMLRDEGEKRDHAITGSRDHGIKGDEGDEGITGSRDQRDQRDQRGRNTL